MMNPTTGRATKKTLLLLVLLEAALTRAIDTLYSILHLYSTSVVIFRKPAEGVIPSDRFR